MGNSVILNRFPKSRPPLPEEIAAIYVRQYKENRQGDTTAASLAQRMEAWMHRHVARDVRSSAEPRSTLEIGAGTLNQLQYEPVVGPYDIVEPFTELFANSAALSRVREVFSDIAQVPAERRYDRITTIATFEHICNLPAVIATCATLLAPGGALRVAIPSEGTLLWTLGWKLTTGLEFRWRHGLDYGQLMKHEHVNTAREIASLLRHFFHQVRGRSFGLCPTLSLYQFYDCRGPDMDRSQFYLSSL